jgi:glyoxylase-like metal-dependent hydrolase (beta-lactamase superfamily II)
VGDWSRAVVLTTHGHPDHSATTIWLTNWAPARDLDQMRDPSVYWTRSLSLAATKVVSLFQPLRPFASASRPYEERPLERIRVGSARLTGWTFADGAVAARGP